MEHLGHQPLHIAIIDLQPIERGEIARPLLDARRPLAASLGKGEIEPRC